MTSLFSVYWALLTKQNNSRLLPDSSLHLVTPARQLFIDKANLSQFSKVITWQNEVCLPPTYLQTLSFQDCLTLMASKDFPLRPLGLVHINNNIKVFKEPIWTAPFNMQTVATNLQPHNRGYCFDFVTTVRQQSDIVYQSIATNLAIMQPKMTQRVPDSHEDMAPSQQNRIWQLAADTGRQYAKVSGDYNPIHLYRWSAKLFGFKSAIAHGMFCLAKSLSSLEQKVFAKPLEISTRFYSPVLLPAKPAITVQQNSSEEVVFALDTDSKKHLSGCVKPLQITDVPI
ncbi:MAG: MaoC/PaaZ C-terminal domain-containing protein [Aestuariibacter sp.]